MSTKFTLRLLEPSTDLDLYREAYSWRKSKRRIQPDRLPFEEFAAESDTQLTVGLFNGELQAVYFLHETEVGDFQCHFSTRRGLSRDVALEGARHTARLLLTHGARQLHAWVTQRNRPLCSFLESLGFTETETRQFPLRNDTDSGSLPFEGNQPSKTFVKYVLKGRPS